MKSLIVLSLLSHILCQNGERFDVCQLNDGNLAIKDAFRIDQHIYFMTQDNGLIRGDLVWHPENESLQITNVTQMDAESNPSSKAAFSVNYPGQGVRVIYVLEQQVQFN